MRKTERIMKSAVYLSLLAVSAALALEGCDSNASLCQSRYQAGNYGDALKYCGKDQKNPASRYIEALIHMDKMIPDSSQEKGLKLMKELAAAGDHQALAKLARSYAAGSSGVPQNEDLALDYYRQDLAHKDPAVMLEFSALALAKNRPEEALPVLEDLLRGGNMAARQQLAMYLVSKKDPTEKDYRRAIELLKPAAEGGDAEAAHALGMIYRFQDAVRDPNLAEKYFTLAAEKGNQLAADMMLTISREQYQDSNTPETRQKFRKWIRVNAENGAHNAENLMGLDYLTGFIGSDIAIDEEEGLKWLIRSVDGENRNGMYYLAKYYLHRYHTPEYFRKAAILLREAALKGQIDAARDLGEYLVQGRISFSGSEEESRETREENRRLGYDYLDRASRAGDYKASERLGALLISGKYGQSDPERGVKILEKATWQGSRVAPCLLYEVYRDGMGSIQKNSKKAVAYLYTAVGSGNNRYNLKDELAVRCFSEAAIYLATLKETGKMGVSRDEDAALSLLNDACRVNENRACYRLGEHYLNAPEPDYSRAYGYFAKAASRGMPEAFNTLGNMSYEGKIPKEDGGSKSNVQAAMRFYARAAGKKYYRAMENMARLYEDGGMFREAYQWYAAAETCGSSSRKGESLLAKLSPEERSIAKQELGEFLKVHGCTGVEPEPETVSMVSRTADAAPGSEMRLYDSKKRRQ